MNTPQAKRKAVVWMLQGKSLAFIARSLNMDRVVIDSWKSDASFMQLMDSTEDLLNETADRKLRSLRRKAVEVLSKALHSKDPREYQWAVSKLFVLTPDFMVAGTQTPTKRKEAESLTSFTDEEEKPMENRKSLMDFLEATRPKRGRVA